MREELKIYDVDLDELRKSRFAVLSTEKGDIKLRKRSQIS